MCLATLWKSFALCHVVSTARPRPPGASCWEAAGLGEGPGRTPCTSPVFLAQAPPDGRPVHTAQNLPGCAPAGGTQPPGRGALRGPFAAGDWQHPWVGGRAASSAWGWHRGLGDTLQPPAVAESTSLPLYPVVCP